MLPKNFFENFFQGKQENNLFVCMPFPKKEIVPEGKFDNKFQKIKEIATKNLGEKYNFKDVIRTKEEWAMGDITEEIFNGIAHSKMLLFDLSDDPKYKDLKNPEANPNVIYELGVALTFRSKEDVLLIREKSTGCIKDLPFDINHLKIQEYENLEEIKDLLIYRLDHQEKYKERLLAGIAREIDDIGFFIIRNFPPIYNGKNIYRTKGLDVPDNFNIPEVYMWLLQTPTTALTKPSVEEVRVSVLRLLDLGVITSEAKYEGDTLQYSYHWTDLGLGVAEYMRDKGGT